MEGSSTGRPTQSMQQSIKIRSFNPLGARDNNQMPLQPLTQLSNAKLDTSSTINDPTKQSFAAAKHVLLPAMPRQANQQKNTLHNPFIPNDENTYPGINAALNISNPNTTSMQNVTVPVFAKTLQQQQQQQQPETRRPENFAALSPSPAVVSSSQTTSPSPLSVLSARSDANQTMIRKNQPVNIPAATAAATGPVFIRDISDRVRRRNPNIVAKPAATPETVSENNTQNTQTSTASPARRASVDTPKQTTSPSESSQKSQKEDSTIAKPKKRTPQKRKQPQSTLYQTCDNIWSEIPVNFGEYSHDDVIRLTNLLKVRLTQAKYRALNSMEHSPLREQLLADEGALTLPVKEKKPIRLSYKCHQTGPNCMLTTVGNGRNLFMRKDPNQSKKPSMMTSLSPPIPERSPVSNKRSPESPVQNKRPQKKQRKATNGKRQKEDPDQLKRRAAAREAVKSVKATTLKDGTKAYVCAPCNKKYKNKNGLVYHMERCKYHEHDDATNTLLQSKVESGSQRSDDQSIEEDELVDDDTEEESSKINCLCDKPNADIGTMIQCDKCNTWFHLACTGLTKDDLDDDYYCSRCVQSKLSTPVPITPEHKNVSEEEYELEDDSDTASDWRATPFSKKEQVVEQIKEAAGESSTATPPMLNLPEIVEPRPVEPTPASATEEDSSQAMAAMVLDDNFRFASEPAYEQSTPQVDTQQQDERQFMSEPLMQNNNDTQLTSTDDSVGFFTTWSPSDLGIFQPPSLLYSDATAMEDEPPLPPSDIMPDELHPNANDALWLEFANFSNDYQCEDNNFNDH